jgi:hypothetical protein
MLLTFNQERIMVLFLLYGGRGRNFEKITPHALMIHRTNGQVLPFVLRVALRKNIESARLVVLEDIGHTLPRGVCNIVLPSL